MSFASFLSSPTIRVRILATHPDQDEKSYTVHRSLLKSHTNLLAAASVKARETTCALPASTSAPAFEAVLEYLYTGNYQLANAHTSSATDETAPEPSPVLQAAMKGAIGVWGRPAAINDYAVAERNISSYESTLFPGLWTNGYASFPAAQQQQQQTQQPPSPPPSPTLFDEQEPSLNEKKTRVVVKSTPATRLAGHLEVYELARRYAVKELSKTALENVQKEVVASPQILRELVRAVYGTKQRNEELRHFVVGVVVKNFETLRGEKMFSGAVDGGGRVCAGRVF